jgi:hypothetical protein
LVLRAARAIIAALDTSATARGSQGALLGLIAMLTKVDGHDGIELCISLLYN